MELVGKVAVVTGGGSGIGAGMLHAFHAAGMHVIAADIETPKAEAVVGQLIGDTRAVAVTVDVTDVASVAALADRAFEEFGAVHVLCNNAGVLLHGSFTGLTPQDWQWVLGVNVFGVINGLHAFLPRMLQQSEGHIVNTASTAAFVAGPSASPYAASKHACRVISESLRLELAGTGIGVSGLYPGPVDTAIKESQRNRQDRFGAPIDFTLDLGERAEDIVASRMLPIQVGRLVRDAIVNDVPWIFTHPDWVEWKHSADREADIANCASWCSDWLKRNPLDD